MELSKKLSLRHAGACAVGFLLSPCPGAVSTSSIYIISRGLFFNVKKKFSDASVACEGLAIALHF